MKKFLKSPDKITGSTPLSLMPSPSLHMVLSILPSSVDNRLCQAVTNDTPGVFGMRFSYQMY